jgi:annexin A7/11
MVRASRDPKPTVVAHHGFNPEHDCDVLRKAMKGAGTDEDKLIAIICARNSDQIEEIKKVYQQCYGRHLLEDLKSEVSGHFQDVMVSRMFEESELDAYILKHAVKGAGTDEDAIIEVMCTRDNDELDKVKSAYKKLYKGDLMKDLIGDTSGDFKRLLVSMSAGDREEGHHVDNHKAEHEAKKLHDAGEGKMGTDEEAFNLIFARRSWAQLRETFNIYQQKYNKKHGIFGAIQSEFGGSIGEAYHAIAVTALEGREAYFAEKLYKSMKGMGTNDKMLIRLIVSRCQVDLATVKVHFLKKYKKTLEQFIIDDTAGDYKNALMKLSTGNN